MPTTQESAKAWDAPLQGGNQPKQPAAWDAPLSEPSSAQESVAAPTGRLKSFADARRDTVMGSTPAWSGQELFRKFNSWLETTEEQTYMQPEGALQSIPRLVNATQPTDNRLSLDSIVRDVRARGNALRRMVPGIPGIGVKTTKGDLDKLAASDASFGEFYAPIKDQYLQSRELAAITAATLFNKSHGEMTDSDWKSAKEKWAQAKLKEEGVPLEQATSPLPYAAQSEEQRKARDRYQKLLGSAGVPGLTRAPLSDAEVVALGEQRLAQDAKQGREGSGVAPLQDINPVTKGALKGLGSAVQMAAPLSAGAGIAERIGATGIAKGAIEGAALNVASQAEALATGQGQLSWGSLGSLVQDAALMGLGAKVGKWAETTLTKIKPATAATVGNLGTVMTGNYAIKQAKDAISGEVGQPSENPWSDRIQGLVENAVSLIAASKMGTGEALRNATDAEVRAAIDARLPRLEANRAGTQATWDSAIQPVRRKMGLSTKNAAVDAANDAITQTKLTIGVALKQAERGLSQFMESVGAVDDVRKNEIMRALDVAIHRPDAEAPSVGMAGLSEEQFASGMKALRQFGAAGLKYGELLSRTPRGLKDGEKPEFKGDLGDEAIPEVIFRFADGKPATEGEPTPLKMVGGNGVAYRGFDAPGELAEGFKPYEKPAYIRGEDALGNHGIIVRFDPGKNLKGVQAAPKDVATSSPDNPPDRLPSNTKNAGAARRDELRNKAVDQLGVKLGDIAEQLYNLSAAAIPGTEEVPSLWGRLQRSLHREKDLNPDTFEHPPGEYSKDAFIADAQRLVEIYRRFDRGGEYGDLGLVAQGLADVQKPIPPTAAQTVIDAVPQRTASRSTAFIRPVEGASTPKEIYLDLNRLGLQTPEQIGEVVKQMQEMFPGAKLRAFRGTQVGNRASFEEIPLNIGEEQRVYRHELDNGYFDARHDEGQTPISREELRSGTFNGRPIEVVGGIWRAQQDGFFIPQMTKVEGEAPKTGAFGQGLANRGDNRPSATSGVRTTKEVLNHLRRRTTDWLDAATDPERELDYSTQRVMKLFTDEGRYGLNLLYMDLMRQDGNLLYGHELPTTPEARTKLLAESQQMMADADALEAAQKARGSWTAEERAQVEALRNQARDSADLAKDKQSLFTELKGRQWGLYEGMFMHRSALREAKRISSDPNAFAEYYNALHGLRKAAAIGLDVGQLSQQGIGNALAYMQNGENSVTGFASRAAELAGWKKPENQDRLDMWHALAAGHNLGGSTEISTGDTAGAPKSLYERLAGIPVFGKVAKATSLVPKGVQLIDTGSAYTAFYNAMEEGASATEAFKRVQAVVDYQTLGTGINRYLSKALSTVRWNAKYIQSLLTNTMKARPSIFGTPIDVPLVDAAIENQPGSGAAKAALVARGLMRIGMHVATVAAPLNAMQRVALEREKISKAQWDAFMDETFSGTAAPLRWIMKQTAIPTGKNANGSIDYIAPIRWHPGWGALSYFLLTSRVNGGTTGEDVRDVAWQIGQKNMLAGPVLQAIKRKNYSGRNVSEDEQFRPLYEMFLPALGTRPLDTYLQQQNVPEAERLSLMEYAEKMAGIPLGTARPPADAFEKWVTRLREKGYFKVVEDSAGGTHIEPKFSTGTPQYEEAMLALKLASQDTSTYQVFQRNFRDRQSLKKFIEEVKQR